MKIDFSKILEFVWREQKKQKILIVVVHYPTHIQTNYLQKTKGWALKQRA